MTQSRIVEVRPGCTDTFLQRLRAEQQPFMPDALAPEFQHAVALVIGELEMQVGKAIC